MQFETIIGMDYTTIIMPSKGIITKNTTCPDICAWLLRQDLIIFIKTYKGIHFNKEPDCNYSKIIIHISCFTACSRHLSWVWTVMVFQTVHWLFCRNPTHLHIPYLWPLESHYYSSELIALLLDGVKLVSEEQMTEILHT